MFFPVQCWSCLLVLLPVLLFGDHICPVFLRSWSLCYQKSHPITNQILRVTTTVILKWGRPQHRACVIPQSSFLTSLHFLYFWARVCANGTLLRSSFKMQISSHPHSPNLLPTFSSISSWRTFLVLFPLFFPPVFLDFTNFLTKLALSSGLPSSQLSGPPQLLSS